MFDPNFPPAPPASSKLLLTPSTAHTPRFLYSSTSYISSLIPSPNIEQGLCCNTPNRLRLEEDGLGTNKFVLGRGAYGTVVLGQWKGKKVAIKLMEKEEGGKSARRRKSLESELLARNLEHENIVKVFGVHAADDRLVFLFSEDPTTHFNFRHAVIIMEYVGSRNLHRLLVELKDKSLGKFIEISLMKYTNNCLRFQLVTQSSSTSELSPGPLPQQGCLAHGHQASQHSRLQPGSV